MRILNRAAFVVTPKEPYLRWAASLGEDAPEQAQDLANEVAVYLVPEISTGEGETPPLGGYFEKIFEIELEAWSTDESGWPALRDLKTFDPTVQNATVDVAKTINMTFQQKAAQKYR